MLRTLRVIKLELNKLSVVKLLIVVLYVLFRVYTMMFVAPQLSDLGFCYISCIHLHLNPFYSLSFNPCNIYEGHM